MLIAGTGGFALESLEILYQLEKDTAVFFNNVQPDFTFEIAALKKYPILHDKARLADHFAQHPEFILGLGNPKYRRLLFDLLVDHGGKPYALVSPKATIGKINNTIAAATNIMSGVVITSNVTIKQGVLINLNATIGHDCVIDEFVEICPGVNISGNCTLHKNVFIGTGANILPGITIGENAVVASGAIVTKNVEPFTMVAGNPAVFKKKLP